MLRRLNVLLFVFACSASTFARPTIPDTPAGRILAAWLDAFNNGDRARIDGFVKMYAPGPQQTALTSAQFRGQSGGLILLAITRNDRKTIGFRVQEKLHPTILIGKMEVTAARNPTIQNFALRPVPEGAVLEDVKLDAVSRSQIIAEVTSNLDQFYVFPELAKKMSDSLRAHDAGGDYNAITYGDEFASRLTSDLVAMSHDKHVSVFYEPYRFTTNPIPLTLDRVSEERKAMARDCGIRNLDILPNNIGYFKIDFFADPMACGKTAAAAITFLPDTDAVIFDLRDNGGGDPRMVALLCSYLFDQRIHLNDFYDPIDNKTTEYWTMRFVPGLRISHKPAYALTSSRTFSGAEEFAYDLKNLRRLTVVGETTGGGDHPVSPHKAGEHFIANVPNARSISPATGRDWEGIGVQPDVSVPAADALETAQRLAAERVQLEASRQAN